MHDTIEKCLEVLILWNEAYRNGQPLVSDAVYDVVYDTLQDLVEAKRRGGHALEQDVQQGLAFLNQIGALPPGTSGWVKFTHPEGMLSLNKARNLDELRDWAEKHAPRRRGAPVAPALILSEKLDGISIRLYYENGWLKNAVTRGDEDPMTGQQVGEDITANVVKMKGVQVFLRYPDGTSYTGRVRCEITLRKSDWKAHLSGYDNARNGCAGCAKDEKPSDKQKHLTVISYQLDDDESRFKSAELRMMESMGLEVVRWFPIGGGTPNAERAQIEGIFGQYLAKDRALLDYDIDGLVIEHNDPAIMEAIGVHGRGPEGAVALKFPAESAPTVLMDIVWQVGGTGRLTPVAIFAPVVLAGAKIERASLANLDIMEGILKEVGASHFSVGDVIEVSRRGDVIPKVEQLITPLSGRPLLPLAGCPSCAAKLERDGAYVICTNFDCPAQGVGRILHWITKLGIKDWGESFVQALWDAGLVRDVADLYDLYLIECQELTISGSKVGRKADIALTNLNAQKELPLHVFVGSLGIHLMGRSMVKKLVDAGFDTLDKLQAATRFELEAIPRMGHSKAVAFEDGMRQREALITKLLDAGVTIKEISVGALTGKSFCFTGVRDKDLMLRIEDNGGTMKGSVGKTLNYLVCKDPNGSSGKLKKARGYGVELLSLEDAWDLVGGR
jgi:DNA ligase (NAD+)